ncbi:hypothetical protein M0R45_035924 [Rubus argutus]|uniref:Uncharacterized protein n=1 Tax=Rubus argutus TaxID=59490 RepID=A0AAW1VYS4_RUBAR
MPQRVAKPHRHQTSKLPSSHRRRPCRCPEPVVDSKPDATTPPCRCHHQDAAHGLTKSRRQRCSRKKKSK